MNSHRLIAKKILFLLTFFFALALVGNKSFGQDGKALFQSNCAQCHNPLKVVTGPALQGVDGRVPDKKLLHEWIHNNAKVLASGNKYFTDLFNQYGKTPMNIFP
jgi:mono/diheme cytochrome c family protein